jgi:hypothetical protein
MFEFLIFTRLTRLKGLVSLFCVLFNLYRVVGENFCGVIGVFWLCFGLHKKAAA